MRRSVLVAVAAGSLTLTGTAFAFTTATGVGSGSVPLLLATASPETDDDTAAEATDNPSLPDYAPSSSGNDPAGETAGTLQITDGTASGPGATPALTPPDPSSTWVDHDDDFSFSAGDEISTSFTAPLWSTLCTDWVDSSPQEHSVHVRITADHDHPGTYSVMITPATGTCSGASTAGTQHLWLPAAPRLPEPLDFGSFASAQSPDSHTGSLRLSLVPRTPSTPETPPPASADLPGEPSRTPATPGTPDGLAPATDGTSVSRSADASLPITSKA